MENGSLSRIILRSVTMRQEPTVRPLSAPENQRFQSVTDTVGAGVWYYWIVATDGAAIEANPAGPVSATVT